LWIPDLEGKNVADREKPGQDKGSTKGQPAPAPVGAVMVVGGGIAGMQASLDLADQGYRVILVESKSAIGGHMAQLDKTFPTNDCAMCTISPKLVEVGRHLNIDMMVDTEVLSIDGEAGDFSVTVRHKPRYIDTDKCVGCGDCADVCPVEILDPFNENLSNRHAANKLYPQAVPNAFAIEKLGISPCRDACPAGQRAQGYIALIREGRYEDALRVIKEDNPFPGICGRICNHRCEDACNRALIDEPINIHALKRFVTDKVYENPRQPVEPAERIFPQRVAIIGAGPCGLTAAQDLVRLGYGVTVFEALPVAGGMLRVGVPEYRLPSHIIEREVEDILDLGVELRLNTRVNDLEQLFDEGFDSVLIAVGAHEGVRLPIPGADLEGVLVNTIFLRDVRLGNPPELGKRVLVLGGGNVAVDCARTAVRLGSEVHMACLEPRDAMPCHAWEADAAEEEGVTIHPDRSFTRITNKNGRAAGVECTNVTNFSFDESGRLSVETEPGSEHVIEADTVIFSVGQRAGLAFIPEDTGVGTTRQKTIAINPNTMAATRTGVFAAGDSVSGTAFVIEAVASGHKAAESIHRYLQGEALEPEPKPVLPVVTLTSSELQERVARGEIKPSGRVPMPELPLKKRRKGFDEVQRGYTDELAQAEAARCLACAICSECLSCQYTCQADAINHDMVESIEKVHVGAVILAPGFQAYRAELSKEYGLGRYPNVVTSLQLERLLSASGPTAGHVQRPSDGKPARRIAFLQCVGSRDQSHDYCSSVCCMYAAKEAVMIKEHDQEAQVHIFMMDMRAFSKGYEAYYQRARTNYGIQYTRCRISALREDHETNDLLVRFASNDSGNGASGSSIREEKFDLVVLSVGMEISESVRELGRDIGIELDEYGFCHTALFDPIQTSRPGIYAAGPFVQPKDIPETVVEASGAAASAAGILAASRHSLTRTREYPPERDVSEEDPRIGVFVCHCGSNIGGFVDVPDVTDYALDLPSVVHAENNLYTCSQDSIAHITETVKELDLNRVVVASCTPHTHAALFQDSIRAAGLNPALFEMANIRNQCSWVHSHDKPIATKKSKELVSMAVARAAVLAQLSTSTVPMEASALVIGGGVAGMSAALSLARGGFGVHLVERETELGGNLRHVYSTVRGDDPQGFLEHLVKQVRDEPRIQTYLGHEVAEIDGFVGNFTARLTDRSGQQIEIPHGVTIVATGGQEYRGEEYLYAQNPRVVTGLEFEQLLAKARGKLDQLEDRPKEAWQALGKKLPNDVAMILCVGPAEQYCGRICCTTALKNAVEYKQLHPEARVTVLYKDIRTYGFKERLYTEARDAGVIFMRYDDEHLPEVRTQDGALEVHVQELNVGQPLVLHPDLLMLSTPVVPAEGAHQLATTLKCSLDGDGFFLEAHIKLRPVDFSTEGFFMAGMAHYPKLLDETIVQAQAAAARASRLLALPSLTTGGSVAQIDPEKCVGCLTCVRVCPFHVPQMSSEIAGVGQITGAAVIEPTICRGCGTCASECPAKAIQLAHYRDDQIIVKLEALKDATGKNDA
jgi:heterodisulfide reductase subunit A-like polyferredoxin